MFAEDINSKKLSLSLLVRPIFSVVLDFFYPTLVVIFRKRRNLLFISYVLVKRFIFKSTLSVQRMFLHNTSPLTMFCCSGRFLQGCRQVEFNWIYPFEFILLDFFFVIFIYLCYITYKSIKLIKFDYKMDKLMGVHSQ